MNFVFANISCSLGVKLNDSPFKYFNNDKKLLKGISN